MDPGLTLAIVIALRAGKFVAVRSFLAHEPALDDLDTPLFEIREHASADGLHLRVHVWMRRGAELPS